MTSSSRRRLFGTDGIRGVANRYPMTSEVALALGRALAFTFRNGHRHRKILIGKDTRLSGYMIEMALASGISSMGADVLLVGPMPTAGVAFLTHGMRAEAGVMISASHNPFPDNGIKIFDHEGFKLPDEKEQELETLMNSPKLETAQPPPDKIGKAFRVEEARGRYIEFLKGSFPRGGALDGIRMVLDCANGAAYEIAPTVFEELGAEVVATGIHPNGLNINDQVGAVYPDETARLVKESGAALGIALDGDADRAIFVDEKGEILDGDAILAICGEELLARRALKENTVVTTIMSNLGLEDYLKRRGGVVVRTPVGDRYLIEAMRKNGYLFGGEPSGHLIFAEYATTGDGILAALQILALMQRRERPLSELVREYVPWPQVRRDIRVRRRIEISNIPEVVERIHQIENRLGKKGRVVVRYSGTEPLLRLMIEGHDPHRMEEMAQDLASCIEKALGVHG